VEVGIMRGSAALLAAALGVLLLAPEAPARAPTSQERGGLDWLLRQLQRDREEDAKAPRQDPTEALVSQFGKGELEFERWPEVAKIAMEKDPRVPFTLREKAATSLVDRVKFETERKTEPKMEPRAVAKARQDICRFMLGMMMDDQIMVRQIFKTLLDALYPGNGVEWRVGDSTRDRGRAYNELKKKLRG